MTSFKPKKDSQSHYEDKRTMQNYKSHNWDHLPKCEKQQMSQTEVLTQEKQTKGHPDGSDKLPYNY